MIGLTTIAAAPAIGPATPTAPHRAGNDQSSRPRPSESAPRAPAGVEPRPSGTGLSRSGLIDGAAAVAAQESTTAQDEERPATLTDEERREAAKMRARDGEVRAHEQAHKAAGGAYAGAVSLTYARGPDGKRYAVAGEVTIDTAPIDGDPRATIAKLTQVKRAALAPASPSGPDRAIAASATAAILEAQSQLAAERTEDTDKAMEIIPPGQAEAKQPGFSFTV